MKICGLLIFLSYLYIFFPVSCFASAGDAGTTVFEFLKIPTTAAQAGLAGMTGFSSDAGANSHAMLDFAEGHSLSASYALYFQDTSFNALNFIYVKEKYVFNVSYAGFYYGDMDKYDEDSSGNYVPKGTFNANDLALGAGIGFAVLDELSLGAGVKYVSQSIDGQGISGFAANVSAVYLPEAQWYAVGGFENFGPSVAGYPMPANVYAGVYSFYEFLQTLCGAEIKYFTDGSMFLKGGAEFGWENKLFVRAGYSYPLTSSNEGLGSLYETNLSLGFGAAYKSFCFDYAWSPFGRLGGVNMVTLTINF